MWLSLVSVGHVPSLCPEWFTLSDVFDIPTYLCVMISYASALVCIVHLLEVAASLSGIPDEVVSLNCCWLGYFFNVVLVSSHSILPSPIPASLSGENRSFSPCCCCCCWSPSSRVLTVRFPI